MKNKPKSSKKSKSASKQDSTARNSILSKLKHYLFDELDQRPVPTIASNVGRSLKIFKQHKRPIIKVGLIYAGLYFLFIRVLTTLDTQQILTNIAEVFGDGSQNTLTRLLTIGSLYGESISFGDSQTGLLFALISIVCSLAFIWVLRAIWAGSVVSVRDAFYSGMYPLVPVVLISVYMLIQMLPFTIGTVLLSGALNNSLASSLVEKLFFAGLFAAGLIISGYLIIGSIIALYATTVPGVTPLQALRGSKKLLLGRRFAVLKQVFVFLILSTVLAVLPLLAVIAIHSDAALVATAIMVVLSLPWMHLYFYGLYRDLIDE